MLAGEDQSQADQPNSLAEGTFYNPQASSVDVFQFLQQQTNETSHLTAELMDIFYAVGQLSILTTWLKVSLVHAGRACDTYNESNSISGCKEPLGKGNGDSPKLSWLKKCNNGCAYASKQNGPLKALDSKKSLQSIFGKNSATNTRQLQPARHSIPKDSASVAAMPAMSNRECNCPHRKSEVTTYSMHLSIIKIVRTRGDEDAACLQVAQ
eukprot:1146552-Pelagomonas_calceolata.AAC.4